MKPVIKSLLQTDLYKFSMMQFVLHRCPSAMVKYRFKCRNDIDLLPYKNEIEHQIDLVCYLQFKSEELNYLRTLRFMKPDFIDFLEDFQLKRRHVHVEETNGKLDIWIEGPFVQTIMWEIFLLLIVHEVYSRINCGENLDKYYLEGTKRLLDKVDQIKNYCHDMDNNGNPFLYSNPFKFADFGTRRAFTAEWHECVVKVLARKLPDHVFVGTSNVYLAMKYGLKPIGTMAHECFQAGQALGPRLVDSQKYILQEWAEEYRGDLGIALSDTLGIDKFLKDFDMYFAKLFDGVRHDSGDPFEWCNKVIAHYESMGINSNTKHAVFSDGLDIGKAIEIQEEFGNKINVSFGIGTNLTNDVGETSLQNVIKMIECNGQPVAKISDNPAKTMCEDESFIKYLNDVIKKDLKKGVCYVSIDGDR